MTKSRRMAREPEPNLPTLEQLAEALAPRGYRPAAPRAKAEAAQQSSLLDLPPEDPRPPKHIRKELERLRQLDLLLDHFATTQVPLEEVAAQCQVSVDRARAGLAARGRHV
jgi:hypothetical protein